MSTSNDNNQKAPYLSFKTLKNFFTNLNETSIPSRIDKSLPFLKTQSGATQSSVLASLRFFDLIDDYGIPQPSLKSLVEASRDEEKFKAEWAKVVNKSYAPLLAGLDLLSGTAAQLYEALKELYGYNGETLRKAHSFLLSALDAAGIEVGSHLRAVGSFSSNNGGSKKRKTTATQLPPEQPPPPPPQDPLVAAGNNSPTGEIAVLRLDATGKRVLKLLGPAVVTNEELERIQNWMKFHFIVVDSLGDE
jgi:hypothetical protein